MKTEPTADIVVSVVRGHADEVSQSFRMGEEPARLSVGSRGDWVVSGPAVVPVHLWLSFDGKELLVAAGDAPAQLRGQALGKDWARLQHGDELRFGFALLRVTQGAQAAPRSLPPPVSRRWLFGGAAGATLVLLLGLGFALTRKGDAPAPPTSAEPAAVVAAAPALPTPEPAPEAAPEPPSPSALPLLAPPVEEGAPIALAKAEEAAPALPKPINAYPQNIANRPIPQLGDKPWIVSEEWRAHHERLLRMPNRATAKVLFLGDSITEAWGVSPSYRASFAKFSPLNLGIARDGTQNVLWRLEHGALDGTKPEVVVLMIGINNLAGGFSAQQTSEGVAAILSSIQTRLPSARVLLLAVLPARREASNPLRQTIKDANRLLANMVKPGKVELVDLGAALLEPDGSIAKTTMRDFVHPTPEAFERLSQALAPRLEAMLPVRTPL